MEFGSIGSFFFEGMIGSLKWGFVSGLRGSFAMLVSHRWGWEMWAVFQIRVWARGGVVVGCRHDLHKTLSPSEYYIVNIKPSIALQQSSEVPETYTLFYIFLNNLHVYTSDGEEGGRKGIVEK